MEFLKAALGAALILVAWVAIELAWRRTFGRSENPRLRGCSGCTSTCTNQCDSKRGSTDPRSLPQARVDHGGATA